MIQRAYHFLERIIREMKSYVPRRKVFGKTVADAAFWDGLVPPGKSQKYIDTVSKYVDCFLKDVIEKYEEEEVSACNLTAIKGKIPIWCCWWQGAENMPELVKMCHTRLKQMIPKEQAELYLITLDNYQKYVEFPEHIVHKFKEGIITMTTMSDILRFHLLERYGGYWVDATVFFTGKIPEQYFTGNFFCQRMVSNTAVAAHEACGCNWCGFSMAGPKNSIIFRFMKDAFDLWWKTYDTIIDYVLIDYLLLAGFRHVSAIREIINKVPDNNEDIFEMYQMLNQPYSEEMYQRLTRRNVMHKLTYKMDLKKQTEDGAITLYGYLLNHVYQYNGEF